MILAVVAPAAQAVPVPSLYVVVVPGSDPAQAAQQAMRVELVRLTGTRAAASDPALAGLIDAARQYVQERAMTTGQIQVLFDEAALTAAIGAAGHGIWDANRPLLWVLLPPQAPAVTEALRARLGAAADERGLPITIVSVAAALESAASGASPPAGGAVGSLGAASAAVPVAAAVPSGDATAATAAQRPAATPAAAAVPVLSAANALEAARRAGASAALVAQALPSDPTLLQWTLTTPTSRNQWTGGAELAIDNATDALASAARALDQAPVSPYELHVAGVGDLADFVEVMAAVQAAAGVSQVAVSDADGDQLTLRLQARGSAAELEQVLTSDRLQPTSAGAGGLLQYRYIAGR